MAAATALGACPGSPPQEGDAGRDGGQDAANDAAAVLPDAGPWTPAFVPRRIFRDASVHCEPLPSLTYRPPVRPASSRGEVLWETPITAEVVDAIMAVTPVDVGGFHWTELPMTGFVDGGFTAFGTHQTEVAFGPDGSFRYARNGEQRPYSYTSSLASVDERSTLFSAFTQLWLWDGTRTWTSSAPLPIPAATPSRDAWTAQVQRDAMPAVWQSLGRSVWHASNNTIVSSCVLSGAIEWVIEYDAPLRLPYRGTTTRALDDGSAIVGAGWDLLRVDAEGNVVASRREPELIVDGISPSCGIGVYVGPFDANGRIEWWSLADLSTSAARPLDTLWQPDVSFGDAAMLADCAVYLPRLRGTSGLSQDLLLVSSDHEFVIPDSPITGVPIALDDGGFVVLSVGTDARLSVYGPDGAVRWAQSYFTARAGEPRWSVSSGVLMPDGILYAQAEQAGFGDFFVAIDVDAAPGSLGGERQGTNWARNNGPIP